VTPIVYEGRLFYEPSRIRAAAIYCSDGRLGEHFDDFLQNGLHLPRHDRVALPGGPAALLHREPSGAYSSTAWDALGFLVDVHELRRVLLIAHEGCAFYARQLGEGNDRMEACQCEDLGRVAARIREFAPRIDVDVYFARIRGNRLVFEDLSNSTTSGTATLLSRLGW
jgi:hypothetical protein